ncbi:MAG: hypothetical protein ACOH5I_24065 [Oligoflexus sp.]
MNSNTYISSNLTKKSILPLLGFTLSLNLFSCQRQEQEFPHADFQAKKTEQARAACDDTQLIREMSLSGHFVYKLVLCSSNQSSSGEESMDDIVRLVKKLGPDQMDRFTSFLLRPRPSGNSPEETYPYLTAMSYLLERGTDGDSLSLTAERFGPLQNFLLAIDPTRAIELLMDWKRSGELNEILEEISQFLDMQEPGALSALTNEILTGKVWGASFLANSLDILRHDPLMYELEALLKPELGRSLADSSQVKVCFDEWLNRQDGQIADERCQPQTLAEDTEQVLGASRFASGMADLSEEERENLIATGLAFLDHFSTINSEERYDFSLRLMQSLEEFWQHNRENSRYLAALLDLILSSQAQDFAEVRQAAATLLEPNYDPTLNKLRAKIGESMLQEQLEDLLVKGGDIPGCEGLQLAGLASSDASFASLANALQEFLSPHPACSNIPPLLAAASTGMNAFFHTDCNGVNSSLPCIPFENPPSELFQAGLAITENPALQGRFLHGTLRQIRTELQLDPYYLQSQNLAVGAIAPEIFDVLIKQAKRQEAWTAADLVELDQWLSTQKKLQELLIADFLERLLSLEAERLAAMGQQFQQLIPEIPVSDFRSEFKAARVFAGLYPGGPYEWQMKHDLQSIVTSFDILPPALAERFSEDPTELRMFLQRLKDADAIFKNPSYAKQNEDLIRVWVPGSSIGDYLGFTSSGEWSLFHDQMLRPALNFSPSLDPEDANWALWDRFMLRSALISKDIPAHLAKDFETWAMGLYGQFFDQSYWLGRQELAEDWQLRPDDPSLPDYFDSQPYETWEARAIMMYIMQHYYKSDRLLPAKAQFSGSDMTSAEQPLQGFMNASFLSSPYEVNKPWSVFISLFPETLKAVAAENSYTALRQNLLPTYSELGLDASGEGFFEVRGYGFRRNIDDFSPEIFSERLKLFSSLNLLSFTQDRNAAYPQPVVGFAGKVCSPARDAETMPCPIEIAADLSAEQAYEEYRRYIQAQFDQSFCPLFQPELAQALRWDELLGFSQSEWQPFCQNQSNDWQRYEWDESLRFPTWVIAAVSQDIFQLGKNPRLKSEIHSLAAHMRWLKLQAPDERQAGLQKSDRARAWLQTSSWQVSPSAAGKARYRQQAAATLWSDQPTLLHYYLGAIEEALPAEIYEIFLIEKGQTDPATGERIAGIEELLGLFIRLQEKHEELGSSSLRLLLDMQAELVDNHAARQALAHILLQQNSLQNYDFLGRDLPLALMGLFGNRFDWQDPGLLFAKQVLLRPHLSGFVTASNRIRSSELQTGLDLLQEQLDRLGEAADQERILRIFLDLGRRQLSAYQTGREGSFQLQAAQQMDRLLKVLTLSRFDQAFHQNFHRWIGHFKTELSQLDGKPGPSLRDFLGQSMNFFITQAGSLVELHWQAKTSSRDEEFYWSNLGLDLLEPIQADRANATAFRNFLADPRLGLTGDDPLMKESLSDPATRNEMVALLDSFEKAEQSEWLAASQEMGDFLRSTQRFLVYADERMVWKDKGSAELAQSLRMLRRFAEDAGDLWDKQLELIDGWFDGIPQESRLRLTPQDQAN